MTKKIFKGIAIFIGVIFLLLLILPFAFKGKITKIAKEQINNNVNATVNFQDLSISLLRNFPNVSVDLQELSVINEAPFQGDTLAFLGHTYINIDLKSLLGDVPKINSIKLADVYVDVKVNKDNVANYDIALPSEEAPTETETSEETAPFSLAIQEYSLENINLNYLDQVSHMSAKVVNFNHSGSGDLSQSKVDLDTHTTADAISFMLENVAYLKDLKLNYHATVGVDYANDLKLTFKDNHAEINDLNLAFDGAFEMLENAYNLDFTFKSEKSEFKSLLSLIPNAYTADFPKVETTGTLDLHGEIKGQYSETTIPTMDIVLLSENASVHYPDLPNTIENININTHITNTTGIMDDIVVEVKNFGFKIAKDVFAAKATVTKPISNPTIQAAIDGQVDLENLKNAYPIPPLEYDLKGIINAHIASSFDMNSIEKEQYQNIKNQGNVTVKGMMVGSEFTPNPIFIEKTKLTFNTKNVSLDETTLKTGDSDVNFQGTLDNLYSYIFSDDTLEGKLAVTSQLFKVSDFYEADTTAVDQPDIEKEAPINEENTEDATQLKIPNNIDILTTIDANKVVYDNMELSNFEGKATVKNQKISFDKANANIFNGSINISGYMDTAPDKTAYNFDMAMSQVDIESAFNGMGMLEKIAPIIGAFKGRFDTEFELNGILGNDFMPDLTVLAGAALGNFQVDKIDASNNTFLSLAESKLDFLDFDKLNLDDLKGQVTFENSEVTVKPFTFKLKDIPVTISGTHGFDNKMSYSLNLDLPSKYLGSQAQNIVSKLSGADQDNITVPLNVNVGGTITKPSFAPDMKSAISALTTAVVDNQKEKVKKVATDKINNLLGIKKDTTSNNSSTADQVKETGKKLLKGLFGK